MKYFEFNACTPKVLLCLADLFVLSLFHTKSVCICGFAPFEGGVTSREMAGRMCATAFPHGRFILCSALFWVAISAGCLVDSRLMNSMFLVTQQWISLLSWGLFNCIRFCSA